MSKNRNENLGCIDPHGMWPFPASREVCPKCAAIKARDYLSGPSRDRGFNWVLPLSCVACLLFWFAVTLVIGAWLFNWRPL